MATFKSVGTTKMKLTDEIRKMIEAETAHKPQPKELERNGSPNPKNKK